MTRVDPGHIMQTAAGFGMSRALLGAVGMELFTPIKFEVIPPDGPSGAAIACK